MHAATVACVKQHHWCPVLSLRWLVFKTNMKFLNLTLTVRRVFSVSAFISSLLFEGRLSPGLGFPSWIMPPNIVAASNKTVWGLDFMDKQVPTDHAGIEMLYDLTISTFLKLLIMSKNTNDYILHNQWWFDGSMNRLIRIARTLLKTLVIKLNFVAFSEYMNFNKKNDSHSYHAII